MRNSINDYHFQYLQATKRSKSRSKVDLVYKHSRKSSKDQLQQSQKSNQYFAVALPVKCIRNENTNLQNSSQTYTTSRDVSTSSKRSFYKGANSTTFSEFQQKKYEKKIEILQKQLRKKDALVSSLMEENKECKQYKAEIIETYRAIDYYEGKIKGFQKICALYEGKLNEETLLKITKNNKAKQPIVSEILDDFRKQNLQLTAQVEQQSTQIQKLNTKIRSFQTKCMKYEQKISELNRKKQVKKQGQNYERQNILCNKPIHQESMNKKKIIASTSHRKLIFKKHDEEYSEHSKKSVEKRYEIIKKIEDPNFHLGMKNINNLYGNLNSRINNIDKQLEYFKKENQKLAKELNQKIKQNCDLKEKLFNQSIEIMKKQENKFIKSNNETLTKKDQIHQIIMKDSSQISKNKKQQEKKAILINTKKGKKRQQAEYKFEHISRQSIKRLIFKVIRTDVSHECLAEMISQNLSSSNPNNLIDVLENDYELSAKQTSEFMFENKQIHSYLSKERISNDKPQKDLNQEEERKITKQNIKSIFLNNIPSYTNITIRKEDTLTKQISNKIKNYQTQLDELTQKHSGYLSFENAQLIFSKQWGFTNEEIIYIELKSFEETLDMQSIDLEKIKSYIENY